MAIKVKRIYEPPSRKDGLRVLVDRIWPRGLSKTAAAVDLWARDLAPSTTSRKWFGHDSERWEAFCARYARELDTRSGETSRLKAQARKRTVTLLFAAKDSARNNAVALKHYLDAM